LKCYLGKHPDAHEWTPDNPDAPHAAKWYKFYVDSVYYFGGPLPLPFPPPQFKRRGLWLGFGNVSYIGFLPMDLYHSINLDKSDFQIQS